MDFSKERNLRNVMMDSAEGLEDTGTARNERFIRSEYADPTDYDRREAAARVQEARAKALVDGGGEIESIEIDAETGEPKTQKAPKLREGFIPISNLKPGFKPISEAGPKLKEGFKPIEQVKKQSLPKEPPIQPGSMVEDFVRRTVGTGVQITDILGQALTMLPSWAEDSVPMPGATPLVPFNLIKDPSKNQKQLVKGEEDFTKKHMLSEALKKAGIDPGDTNPAIDKVMEVLGDVIKKGVKGIAGQFEGPTLNLPANATANLPIDELVNNPDVKSDFDSDLWGGQRPPMDGSWKEVDSQNPLANKRAEEIIGTVMGVKSAKKASAAIDNRIIEGQSRRISTDDGLLPAPEKPAGTAVAALEEQAKFTERNNATAMQRYNQDPAAFGVDETATVNPFVAGGAAGSTMKFDPVDGYHTLVSEDIDAALSVNTDSIKVGKSDEVLFESSQPEIIGKYLEVLEKNRDNGSFMEVIDFISKHHDDPFLRALTKSIHDPAIDATYRLFDSPSRFAEKEAFATTINKSHDKNVVESYVDFANGKVTGASATTMAHEGLHVRLAKAYEIGRDSVLAEKYPDLANFHTIVSDLWVAMRRDLPKEVLELHTAPFGGSFAAKGSPGHELITHGLTNPSFVKVMKQVWIGNFQGRKEVAHGPTGARDMIKLQTQKPMTVWEKFGDAVMDAIGLSKHTTAAKREALRDRVLRFLEIRDQNRTAFEELSDAVFPILNATKGIVFPESEVARAFSQIGVDKLYLDHARPPQNTPPLSPKEKVVLERMVSPWESYEQMVRGLHQPGKPVSDLYTIGKFPDLHRITGNVYPIMEVKNVAGNPVVSFAGTKIRDIHGATHVLEVILTKSIKEFADAPLALQARIVQGLSQMNRPEIMDILKQNAEQMWGPNWRDDRQHMKLTSAELGNYGIAGPAEQLYRRTLEPLFETLYKIDKVAIKKGFGRNFISDERGYFPRSFGYGKFSVKVFNVSGALVYFHRAGSFKEIQEIANDIKTHFPAYNVVREVGKDYTDFKGHLLALAELDPNSTISKIGQRTIEAAEEHRRTQEFERNARGVAGFLGQNIDNPKEIELQIQSIYHRIQQSTEAYKTSRLLTELLRPIQKDPVIRTVYKNAVEWVETVVRRELGGNISQLGWIDKPAQMILNQGNKAWLKFLDATTKKRYTYDLKPGEQTIAPETARELSRYLSASGSAYVLIGNVPNLLINSLSIPLVSLMGGFPDAQLLRRDPATATAQATLAHTQSVYDMASLLAGKADPSLRNFFKEAINRGLIMANAFADIPEMRAQIEKGPIQRGTDAVLNVPRQLFNDPVEVATNFAALSFYRRLVQNMYPQMDKKRQFKLTVELAKRYTGDYARYNKALMWDKAGVIGQMASNFNIWIGTRLGQFHEVSKEALRGHVKPLVSILAATSVVAGLNGLPMMQDYENFRQAVNRQDGLEMNLPPMDLMLRELGIPEWVREGVALNHASQAANFIPGVDMPALDMSGRGKWAGFSDIGGVTYTLPAKAWGIYNYIYNKVQEATPQAGEKKGQGTTIKQDASFVRSLPQFAQGYAREQIMTRSFTPDGGLNVLSSNGNVMYKQKPEDKWVNRLGFRTKEQGNDMKEYYNTLYSDKTQEKEIRKFKEKLINQALKAIDAEKRGDMEKANYYFEAVRVNAKNLVEQRNTNGLKTFSKDIREGIVKQSDTLEVRQLKELSRTGNAFRVLQILDNLSVMENSSLRLKQRKTEPPSQ